MYLLYITVQVHNAQLLYYCCFESVLLKETKNVIVILVYRFVKGGYLLFWYIVLHPNGETAIVFRAN